MRPIRILKKLKIGDRWKEKTTSEIATIKSIVFKTKGKTKFHSINYQIENDERIWQTDLYHFWSNHEKIINE